jgi:hypothetical protein
MAAHGVALYQDYPFEPGFTGVAGQCAASVNKAAGLTASVTVAECDQAAAMLALQVRPSASSSPARAPDDAAM